MKKAFSLFELSIVILIIALILVGTVQTTKLIKKSHLASAQALTQNSIVNNLDGLVAWYETSLDSSFDQDQAVDGALVRIWYDNNPKALTKNNALQNTDFYKPTYTINVFNGGIPAMRFNNSVMDFDGTSLAYSAYTIFVVEQRRSSQSENYFLGGLTLDVNQDLVLGYRDDTTITQSHYGNDINIAIDPYDTPIPRLHTFMFDTTHGKTYRLNGVVVGSDSSQTEPLTSYYSAAVGRYNGSVFVGDIGEVIIFRTKLSNDNMREVEIYLSKKYGISLS